MTSSTPPSGAGPRFRQRKIAVKQTLRIVWQKDIPDVDDDSQREIIGIETGVEKGEEEEHHLQAVLNASNAAVLDQKQKAAQIYIPTPSASTVWPDYAKYYKSDWAEPDSYIRQSATVEDASGCPYNMDEEDAAFLSDVVNKGISDEKQRCSEDEFEMISYLFESTVTDMQPFLATDPKQLLDYPDLEALVLKRVEEHDKDPASLEKLLAESKASVFTPKYSPSPYRTVAGSFNVFGSKIYNHYRERKIQRKGKSIFPTLKFEDNAEKDENDPYVCFRHREVRLARKTRRTDQQSNERLRRLQIEMEQAKSLFKLVAKRENWRLQAIQNDWDIFEQQCKTKSLKRKLKISGDDEDLLTVFKKKKEERKLPSLKKIEDKEKEKPRPPFGTSSAPGTGAGRDSSSSAHPLKVAGSKIPDLDSVTLEDTLAEKDAAMRAAIKAKLRSRTQADRGWVNYSDNPFVPYCDFFDPDRARFLRDSETQMDDSQALYSSIASLYPPPATQRLKLPLASSLGKSYAARSDVEPEIFWCELDAGNIKELDHWADKSLSPGGGVSVPRFSSVSLRKRADRGGCIFVDRKGFVKKPSELKTPRGPEEERLVDRFRFDTENHGDLLEDFSGDPARLNGISDATQRIRFGSMLLSKSYEAFQEAQLQRQQQVYSKHQKHNALRGDHQPSGTGVSNPSVLAGQALADKGDKPSGGRESAGADKKKTPNGQPGWPGNGPFASPAASSTNGRNINKLGVPFSAPKVETSV